MQANWKLFVEVTSEEGKLAYDTDDDDDDFFIKPTGLPKKGMLCGHKNRSSASSILFNVHLPP